MEKTAVIKNLFDIKSLIEAQKLFTTKLRKTDGQSNECYGIEDTHILWPWVYNKIFSTIKNKFEQDIKPIFLMYMNAIKPFDVHEDEYWHNDKKLPGQPFVSFLIPISVDNSIDNISKASTVVFNEKILNGNISNNALQFKESFLQHCDSSTLEQISLKNKFDWGVGDLIHWDSTLQHASGSFNNFSSKQCLVGHTYIM